MEDRTEEDRTEEDRTGEDRTEEDHEVEGEMVCWSFPPGPHSRASVAVAYVQSCETKRHGVAHNRVLTVATRGLVNAPSL